MRIDAHQHFWKYNSSEYSWIDNDKKSLRRDFLPGDLQPLLQIAGIDGTVAVQARQTLEETHWLLELADVSQIIRGVVGWVPLVYKSVQSIIEQFVSNRFFKGVRHVVQDEPNDDFILRNDFNRGVALLKDFGLVYDILIFERHLLQTIRFVDQHPAQVFVLDHIAKPRIRECELEPWKTNIMELAKRENVYCKFSGLVTEADIENVSPAILSPYVQTVLEAFGPRRLMFGSDWPVCLLACEYIMWKDWVCQFIQKLSKDEQSCILGRTATEVYHL